MDLLQEHDPALMFAIVIVCMLVSAGLHIGPGNLEGSRGMTTAQILAVSTPIVAFLFMGLIALIERRYDRAPAVAPGQVADTNERTIRRIAEMLREVEPTTASRER
jgi:hypothetical protein